MKILFDSEIFLRQRFGGVSRQFIEFQKAFSLDSEVISEISARIHFNKHLDTYNQEAGIPSSESIYLSKFPNKLRGKVEKFNHYHLRKKIGEVSPTIIHHTFYPMKNISYKIPSIVTVNDLIREKQDPRGDRAIRKKMSCDLADAVICISKTTKNDLIQMLGIDEKKCFVVYLAPSDFFRIPKPNHTFLNDRTNEILYVGNRNGYKNFNVILEAFRQDSELRSNFTITCFGGELVTKVERRRISDYKLEEVVNFTTGDDSTLKQLYARSAVFVYPSLDEGFGIPPLEAMSAGCPTISAAAGAIPEILKSNATYFNPQSSEDLILAIKSLLSDSKKWRDFQDTGFEYSKNFTWENSAALLKQSYRKAIQ